MRATSKLGVGALVLLAATAAAATDLRGRVEGTNSYSSTPFPLGGTALYLYQQQAGQWRVVSSAYTAPNGMYYFRGIAPGKYVLQVERRNYAVQVGNTPLQDVPPVVIAR